jgi:myosin tail region-interacting protein MTI1
VKRMVTEVKAKYDYNSGHEDDLSFTAGQIINIIEEVDEEWYNGAYVDGQGKLHQGMFPRNFVIVTTSHSAVATPVSNVKQAATKETPIKSKVAESAGSPNVSGKQSLPVMPSTSVRSAISSPLTSTPLKSDSRTPVRGTQTLHQPV